MSSKAVAAAAIAAAVWASAPGFADDAPTVAPPDNGGGRYTLSKVGDQYVRLDTRTGEVAMCSQHDGSVGWVCELAPEDRTLLENEIARLRTENAALKASLLAHNVPLPTGVAPEPHSNDVTIRLPSDAEIDRAMSYLGAMWQRFVDAVARMQKQMLNKS